MRHPIILALDTSCPHAGFAVARGENLLASLIVSDGPPHSQTLFGNISRVLQAAEIALADVDLFAAATGPGSFTGLRVGLSAVLGLAFAQGKPALGLDTLSLLALAAGEDGASLITCGAGRHEIYGGVREILSGGEIRNLGEDLVGAPEMVIAGIRARLGESSAPLVMEPGLTAIPEAGRRITIDRAERNLAATLALYAFRQKESAQRRPLEAHYVRPSDAEIRRPQ